VSLKIPTLIIEERTLLREGLAALLDRSQYNVLATAGSVSDLSDEHLQEALLVIIGVSGGMDKTVAAIRKLRQVSPASKIFIVAEGSDNCDSHQLLRHGADGCILDVTSQEVLLKSIDLAFLQQRLIVIGHSGLPYPALPRSAAAAPGPNDRKSSGVDRKLSERERQILVYLARGTSNKAIARQCYITETTVKAHLKAIMRKIAVRNRTQAAIWAIDHGFVNRSTESASTRSLAPAE
jgi:two-component system, NarL family, nitrate/nitrite response regulator NarL